MQRVRRPAALALCGLMLAGGCKTSEDATAAATQMTDTAKALADYYAALEKMLGQSDQLNSIQEAMLQIPYDAATRKQIADAEASVARREALADALTALAGSFTSLASPDAAKNASTSAAALQAQVESIGQIQPASHEINLLATLTQTLVTAVQEHQERAVAKAMSSAIAGLDELFKQEAVSYDSLEAQYLGMAKSLAMNLVDRHQVDQSYFMKDVLGPFDLTPVVTDATLKAKIDELSKKQVETSASEQKKRFDAASTAMEQALKEMSHRIDLVARKKPMTLREPPVQIATVEQWSHLASAH